ncbi:MAG: Nramp family divalent metal transporter, partial [Planctomycetota bacterium]
VGAGDLATAGFAASRLGVAVLWAVVGGAFFKFVLTEGLARWQLATGQTLLEGAIARLGPAVTIVFLLYLLPWSFFVGGALISACGVTMHAIAPVFDDPRWAKLAFGAAHSAVGVAVAWAGGFRLFERIMAGCVGVMFAAVVLTALLLGPEWKSILQGLLVPRIPQFHEGGLTWTIAVMGGVGGTLTVLCYGYWMREEGRTTPDALRICRIDLATGYAVTAMFGLSMMVIASGTVLDGGGAQLVIALAGQLEQQLGAVGKWLFLAGAWAAVFSSLLGVWQAVPYVFADVVGGWAMRRPNRPQPRDVIDTKGLPYRGYLLALATVPLVQVALPFREVQKYYAVIGAAFIPMLALVLLVLNGRSAWVGRQFRNRPVTVAVLIAALAMAVLFGYVEVRSRWG